MAQNIPGVYSEIDASAAVQSNNPAAVIGVVAKGTTGTNNVAYAIASLDDLGTKYGKTSNMYNLVKTAMKNGANKFIVVKVADTGTATEYETALAVLALEEAVNIVLVDSADPLIIDKVKAHCNSASANRKERISFYGYGVGTDISVAKTNATALNTGRVFGVYPNLLDSTGTELAGWYTAAAVAGQVAAELDPSMPMTGVEIKGFFGLKVKLTDTNMNELIEAGVGVLEVNSGVIRIVRLVSTYTEDAESNPDITWQELTTIRISDEVIKDIRSHLANTFRRAKQSQATRDSVRTETINKLYQNERKGYIENVQEEDISVAVNGTDPFRTDVVFPYNVVLPMNTIYLKAYLVL